MRYCGFQRFLAIFAMLFILSSCNDPQSDFQNYLEKGDSFFEQGDFVRARLEYRNAAQIDPTSAQAIYNLGRVEEAEGNLQEALSAYSTAEQQDPAYIPVLLKLAEFYLTAGLADESNARIEKLVELDPELSQPYALKGSLYLKSGQYSLARQFAHTALQKDSENIIAYSVLAGTDIAQGRYKEAQDTINKAIALQPNEISLYLLKATVFGQQNDMSSLTDVYRNIFKIAPDAIGYRFDLAQILIQAGLLQEAQDLYKETVRVFPENEDAKYELSNFLENYIGKDIAEQTVKQFIAANPDQKNMQLWLAQLYVRNQQYENAVQILQETLNQNPDDWIGMNASTALADIQMQQGELDVAQELIDAVLLNDVNNQDALLLRANLKFAEGNYQEAIADLRYVLTNSGDNLKASRLLAEALLLQGRLDLAIDTLIQAVQKNPNDPGFLVRLAQLHVLRDNPIKADEILTLVTNSFPDNPLGWETRARLAIENGQADRASLAIEKLSALDGQDMVATFLQGRLLETTNRQQEAKEYYKSIIGKDPHSPIAAYALTSLTGLAQDNIELINLRDFLYNLNAQNPNIYMVLGAIEKSLGNIESAQSFYHQAISLKPSNQAAYIALADIYLEQQNLQQAMVILEQAENDVPTDMNASMKHAQLLDETGQAVQAIEKYRYVLTQDDQMDVAANNMAQLIADHQPENKEALEEARLIAERFINSDNPYYLDTLGWIYYRLEQIPQAQMTLSRAISLLPADNPQIDYHYGAALFKSGQTDLAKLHLQKAVSSEEKYVGIEDAKRMLNKL